jgi:hypothetical protein
MFKSNRSVFVDKGLETLTSDDSPYKHFFSGKDGEKLADEDYQARVSLLETSLNETYDLRIAPQLKKRGLQHSSTALRGLAGANYGAGLGLFALALGPAGFVFTAAGAGLSFLADAIDDHYYTEAGLKKGIGSMEDTKLAAETVGNKVLGYLPIGTGFYDLFRGRKKFIDHAAKKLSQDEDVVNYAIANFASRLYENDMAVKNIPLGVLKDERYSEEKPRVTERDFSMAG